jgi:hypothetical protein
MMILLAVLPAWSALGVFLLTAQSAEPAPNTATDPQIQPFTQAPELFPILPWDVLHGWTKPYRDSKQGLEGIAECNFTLAGFVRAEDLPLCERLGLPAIMAPAETAEPWFGEWRKLSDAQIDQHVKQMVEKTGDSKIVLGYFLMDEPGTPAFPALAKAVAAVKKYAPGKLAYINLFPSYATTGGPDTSQLGTATYTDYLERFVNEVKPQFLSYDNYMVQYSDDLRDQHAAAIYYSGLLEVRRIAQKYHLPFWNIVSCNQIRPGTTVPSPANLAFQAYTTLAAGGRGVSWFKYYQDSFAYAPIDNLGNKTDTWLYLEMVNKQLRTLGPIMNRLSSTGAFFTSPPPVESLPLLPGRVVKQVQSRASVRGTTTDSPPVMVGEFTDQQGSDYVMIVNLSLEKPTNLRLQTTKPYGAKQVFSAADGTLLPLDEQNGHWLPAGQGVLISLH